MSRVHASLLYQVSLSLCSYPGLRFEIETEQSSHLPASKCGDENEVGLDSLGSVKDSIPINHLGWLGPGKARSFLERQERKGGAGEREKWV